MSFPSLTAAGQAQEGDQRVPEPDDGAGQPDHGAGGVPEDAAERAQTGRKGLQRKVRVMLHATLGVSSS